MTILIGLALISFGATVGFIACALLSIDGMCFCDECCDQEAKSE